jgi:hypothetical protein
MREAEGNPRQSRLGCGRRMQRGHAWEGHFLSAGFVRRRQVIYEPLPSRAQGNRHTAMSIGVMERTSSAPHIAERNRARA